MKNKWIFKLIDKAYDNVLWALQIGLVVVAILQKDILLIIGAIAFCITIDLLEEEVGMVHKWLQDNGFIDKD